MATGRIGLSVGEFGQLTSRGFEHDALADIAEIKDLLRDQYSSDAVFKELIQNADDSSATEVHLAWLPGESNAAHPLLRVPALLALNNGLFRENDAKGIRRIRLGTKAGDLRSIGKFGLGLKSVFHLCESFFYAASGNQPGAGGTPLVDLLNPWGDSGYHDDWNEIELGSPRLLERLEAWPHRLNRWFCVWIPLRTPAVLRGKAPIADEYPDGPGQLGDDALVRIAEMLPLGRSVERVEIWAPSPSGTLVQDRSLSISADSKRRTFPDLEPGSRRRLSGKIAAARGREELWSLDFHGLEYIDEHESFAALKRRDDWPTRPAIDESGRSSLQREKAEPHGAVVLTRRPSGHSEGGLVVSHAVFLPLAETLEEPSCGSPSRYQLLLHGYFFLDAGRIHIDRDNEWNQGILKRAVMPLVLPALDSFVASGSSSVEEAESLTRSISGTSLVADQRALICAEHSWMLCVGPESEEWRLVPASEPFFTLPRPSRPGMAHEVFPSLSSLTSSRRVTYDEAPRITDAEPTPWLSSGLETFEALLNEIDSDSLTSPEQFEYLVLLLEQEKKRTQSDLWKQTARPLVGVGRRVLTNAGAAALFDEGDLLRRFVAVLPEDVWVPLNALAQLLKTANGRRAVAPLLATDIGRLLVPSEVAPASGGGELKPEAAFRALFVIESALVAVGDGSGLASPLSRLALELIDATAGDRFSRRRQLGSLRLVRVHEYRSQAERLTSWNELEALRESGLLFAGLSTHAAALQGALAEATVTRLVEGTDRTASRALFEPDQVRACDATASVLSLGSRPRLSQPEQREELLKKLANPPEPDPDQRHLKAVRFLLHGEPLRYDDTESTLVSDEGSDDASVWGKLARWALDESEGSWRWVPSSLAQLVSRQQAMSLGLEVVGPSAGEALLRNQGVAWVDGSRLSDAEREQVLRTVTDVATWRALPLHQTAAGDLCSLTDATFLYAGVPVPADLSASVTLLRLPSDSSLAAIYRDRVDVFDDERLLSSILAADEPWRMEESVLDALERLGTVPESVPVRSTAWLSTREGPRAPSEVIDLLGVESALRGILSSSSHAPRVVNTESLTGSVLEHAAFRLLRRSLFLSGRAACDALGDALRQDPAFRLGPLPESVLEGDGAGKLLQAFEGVAIHVLPGAAVVGLVRGALSDLEASNSLARRLAGDFGVDRLRGCLQALAEKHATAKRTERHVILDVHDWYLRALLSHQEATISSIAGLSLLNGREAWSPSEALCFAAHGVDAAHILGERHAALLEGFVSSGDKEIGESGAGVTSPQGVGGEERTLAEYLRDFEPYVAPEVLGGFAAVLGDEEAVRETANTYLEPRWSLGNFRQRIDWEIIPESTERGVVHAVGAGEDAQAAMSKQRFIFRVSSRGAAQTWSVSNLLGDTIQVPVSADFDDLLVGQFRNAPGRGYRTYEISLRGIDPAGVGQRRLTDLFRNTASVVLDRVYCQPAANLPALWAELAESEQLDLEVSQRLVLDHALFYVRQLGGRDSEVFAEFGRRFDDIRYREAELERLEDDRLARRELDLKKRSLREDLVECLTHDSQAQDETLAAVRSKVSDFQYEPSSIPFELFQNADDAGAELRQMLRRETPPAQARRLAVSWNESRIVFVYWGRPINQFRLASFSGAEGRRLGYHRDLEKMLVMSSSDKSEEDDLVTGKFGLGFKSVFLFTDRPALLSGRLGFWVLGGVFPQKLEGPDADRLRDHSDAYSSGTGETTVVELERSAQLDLAPVEALKAFCELGHFLPAFSRSIKSIELREEGQSPEHLTWDEESVLGSLHVFRGTLRPSRSSSHGMTPALVVRGARSAALLLGIGSKGFVALPEGTPTFWVTAPTRSLESAGFALNAPLLLDVGRGRLGSVDANLEVVSEFGATIGTALIEIHAFAEDWPAFSSALGLGEATSDYAFWQSLWSVTSGQALAGEGIEPRLLRTALWSESRGVRRLYEKCRALPTALPGAYEKLTCLSDVKFAARGELDSPGVFEGASSLPSFGSMASPGSIVSGSRIGDRLETLLGWRNQLRRLGVADVLNAELEAGRELDGERARALGTVFTSELMSRIAGRDQHPSEADSVREILREFHFETQEGSHRAAQDLIATATEGTTGEERLRAAFAPAGRVLSDSYGDVAVQFCRLCRGDMRAPAELLADWGLAASGTAQREAFLQYLLRGQLASQVGMELRERGAASWLDSLRDSKVMSGFSGPDRLVLLGRIGFDEEQLTTHEPSPRRYQDPQIVLQGLYEWWLVHREVELVKYQQRVYPDGGALLRSLTYAGPQSPEEREAWLALLLRGSLETLGWLGDEQNREFLRLCTKRRWMHDLARGPSPEMLAKHILEYVEHQSEQIPFFHWIGQYSKLFIMARWIDEYAQSFVDVNLTATEPSLRLILSPRVNPEYSGGGPDAPPLGPMLGIGGCFVLRELRRAGAITNPNVDPLCFVPGKAVRTLIEEIGGPEIGDDDVHEGRSRAIWAFLVEHLGHERATFEGDFDIPLTILAKRSDLRDQLESGE